STFLPSMIFWNFARSSSTTPASSFGACVAAATGIASDATARPNTVCGWVFMGLLLGGKRVASLPDQARQPQRKRRHVGHEHQRRDQRTVEGPDRAHHRAHRHAADGAADELRGA